MAPFHTLPPQIVREFSKRIPCMVFPIEIFQTDTDDSNEMVTAYYSEPILEER